VLIPIGNSGYTGIFPVPVDKMIAGCGQSPVRPAVKDGRSLQKPMNEPLRTWSVDLMRRSLGHELMDDPGLEEECHLSALRGLSRINKVSLTTRQLLRTLLEWGDPDSRVRILDLACGGGDVLVSLERALSHRGFEVAAHGCDISPLALEAARENARKAGSGADFSQLDVVNGEIPSGHDFILSSLFLHHLSDEDVVSLLGRMADSADRGLLVSDLERRQGGLLLSAFAPRLLCSSPVVHTDAVRSVKAAFTLGELDGLAEKAGLAGFQLQRCWPFRLLLSWRRT